MCNIPRDPLSAPATSTPACSTLILTAHRLSPAKTSRVIHTYNHKRLLFSQAHTPSSLSSDRTRRIGRTPGALCPSERPFVAGDFFGQMKHTREIIRRDVPESRRDFARHAGTPQSRFARFNTIPLPLSLRSLARARRAIARHSRHARREPRLTRGATSPSVLYE